MKICSRDYSDGSMLATKKVNGIDCCTNCEKPALCHNKSIYYRALFWALSDDTGTSSKTLACHMLEYPSPRTLAGPPSDASDRGRCIRLLELIPEWIPRLQELAKLEKPSEGVMISSSGISAYRNSWAEQIPLILKEGKL